MDMNWIDEIRDPEPRKRYIYNADDYDPQYGDPYYRELSAGVCDPTDPTMGCLQPDSPAAIR